MSSMVKFRVNLEETQMSPLQKIYYITYFITKSFLLAVLTIMILLALFLTFYFGDMLYNIKKGNYKSPLFSAYVIVSPSMVPTINVNDGIIIKRVDEEELNIGDIITFDAMDVAHSGYTITHRIVGKYAEKDGGYFYKTKGDNNTKEDDQVVKDENVHGKVIFRIPKIGYIQKFISTPTGFILCILIPAGIVIVYDLLRVAYHLAKAKKMA